MLTLQKKILLLILAGMVFYPLVHTCAVGHGPTWLAWRLYEFWRIPQLFTRRVAYWPRYHVRVCDAAGEWHELPHGQPSEHETYGHMTRLDHVLMMLDFATDDPDVLKVQRVVLEKICRDLANAGTDSEGAPIMRPVKAVQLIASMHPVAFEGSPQQRWNGGRPANLSDPGTHIIFEQWFDGSDDVPDYRLQILQESLPRND
jgi:hypothetical protein